MTYRSFHELVYRFPSQRLIPCVSRKVLSQTSSFLLPLNVHTPPTLVLICLHHHHFVTSRMSYRRNLILCNLLKFTFFFSLSVLAFRSIQVVCINSSLLSWIFEKSEYWVTSDLISHDDSQLKLSRGWTPWRRFTIWAHPGPQRSLWSYTWASCTLYFTLTPVGIWICNPWQ